MIWFNVTCFAGGRLPDAFFKYKKVAKAALWFHLAGYPSLVRLAQGMNKVL